MPSLPILIETTICFREAYILRRGIRKRRVNECLALYIQINDRMVLKVRLCLSRLYNPKYLSFSHQEGKLSNSIISEF